MTSRSKRASQSPSEGSQQPSLGLCPIPKEAPFKILIDTREPFGQAYSFPSDVLTARIKLEEGDYSIEGFEGKVAVERKTLDDFAQSIISERFWEEIKRVREKAYKSFIVVVEASLSDIHARHYSGQVEPASLLGAVSSLACRSIPVIFCDTRPMSVHYVFSYLKFCWERRYKGLFWPLEPS